MHLKRLACQGFKSFADKTDFDFKPGVTGIVGPNGCGKSNVVDAIKWVLGDQSARSLRGKQMMDVIFNGSGTRKSAAMSQVDLVFENLDRKLSCDTDEVTITRRLYRSGESEYLINGQTVRLKDIRELFMDTGVGVGAYSIIEQGKVDVLLQANPNERRLIFEEAAGISRYKARKKEAERKLSRVDQNLLRIEDIVEEVEKRLRSVKYQAGKARNFQEYDRQLREKRAAFSLAEYHRLTESQQELSERNSALNDQATELRTSLSKSETRISNIDAQQLELETELQQLEQQTLANASEITANSERIEQARSRIEELTEARAAAQRRLAAERKRAVQLRRQIDQESGASEALEQELNEARARVDELAQQDHQMASQLHQLRTQSEDERAGIIELMRRTSQINNEIQSLTQRSQHHEAEKQRIQARQQVIENELGQLEEERATIDETAQRIEAAVMEYSRQLDQAREEAARLDRNRAELNNQLAAAKEYRSGLLSRRQILTDLDRDMEGVDAGIRELLHRKEQDATGQAFHYVRGLVADLVSTDVANAALIEIALGQFDQYVVIEDSQAFFRDAELLSDFPGRVQAICLDRIPPFMDGRDVSGMPGFVAKAMDLVRYPEDGGQLVQHLLGKVIVVRSLNDALEMANHLPPSYRYVTQDGQLFDPSRGICEVGPVGNKTGLISRKSELREIDEQIAEVDGRIETMSGQLMQTGEEIASIEHRQETLRQDIHEAHKQEVQNDAARQTNENAMSRLKQEQPLLVSELQSIDLQIAEAHERAEANRETLKSLDSENTSREQRVAELDQQIEELTRQRSEAGEELTEAKVAVGQIAQRRTLAAERLRTLRDSQQASEMAVEASAREASDSNHRITTTERMVLNAQSRLAELFASKETLAATILKMQRRRQEFRREVEQMSAQMKTERVKLDEIEEQLHKVDMRSQEVRISVSNLLARVREELDIDLAETYENYEHEDQDWEAVEAEIEELKGKIKRLGHVNLDAISEQDELEKRAEFLQGQHQDLRNSQKQLVELIEHLNNECRERFTDTFNAVREHFQDLFRKLFGGGKADVMLEQPADGQPMDVLEAGIEIQARPPGKELQSISLLSGGEKTMTAIALLLAIFRSRPSPFAILDEVDAALDEANNERFNRIVGEFLDKSQFIIITHSKRTMTVADVLYGITMQEAGVSKRVSVQFDKSDEDRSAA